MVLLPIGLLSVWPWEWHVQAANFCLQETHSESHGAPLKMGQMRCLPSPNHNGTSSVHAGLGGRGVCVCVCVCVCVYVSVCSLGGGGGWRVVVSLWNQAVSKSLFILLTWCCYQQDF